ncbi:hypothetical protein H8356DRAFT_1330836 [Neocallimastix lanati (nom. inval.)]|nr:hypothetical protein H8356DRAFT_1330836 [Neocallimastix sp. JGI-2020a]
MLSCRLGKVKKELLLLITANEILSLKTYIGVMNLNLAILMLSLYDITCELCGFKFDISISIKRKIVSEDCPKCCPCFGVSVPSFSHWIVAYDFFLKFAMIIEQKSLDVSLDSEKDYDNNIYLFYIDSTSSTVPYFVVLFIVLNFNITPKISERSALKKMEEERDYEEHLQSQIKWLSQLKWNWTNNRDENNDKFFYDFFDFCFQNFEMSLTTQLRSLN